MNLEALIKKKAAGINIPGYDKDDVEQELHLAFLSIKESTPEAFSDIATAYNIINRHIYKLIKSNSTFEGSNARNKETRKNLVAPSSNFITTEDGTEVDMFAHMPGNLDDPFSVLSSEELLERFKLKLTKIELAVLEHMLRGRIRPRQISIEVHGYRDAHFCKLISNHINKVKNKFRDFWHEQTGKRL